MQRLLLVLAASLMTFPAAAGAHTPPPTCPDGSALVAECAVTGKTDTSISLDWAQSYAHSYIGYFIRVGGGARTKNAGSTATVSRLQPGSRHRICISVALTTSSHPGTDAGDEACVEEATTGEPAEPPRAQPQPQPEPQPTPPPRSPAFGLWRWDARSAAVDPDSAALISRFRSHALVNPNMATNAWAVATAAASSSDPTYTIPRTEQGGSITVRIPLGTRPDPDGDGHLTVRDPTSGTETDFWKAVYNPSTRRISSAAAAVTFALDAANEQTSGWGGNAANTPLARGLVTPESIMAGHLDETMQFGMPRIGGTRSTYRWPALHNAPTCGSSCGGHLVDGTWLRLDPSYDVEASGLPAWQKVIARTLQRHGMILRDNSRTLVIYGKNPINGGQSWAAAGLGSAGSVAFSAGFPWSRLQVLRPPGP